jgi:hypothetical protein
MIKIPTEAVEAAARALADDANLNWDDVPFAQDVMRGEARAAITAALNAWPNAEVVGWYHADHTLILPLSTEKNDD